MPTTCCRTRRPTRRASIDEAKTYSDQVVAQAQGDAERFKQVYAAVLESAGGDPRAHVPGHHAADLFEYDEGICRQQGRQQRAVSAARQAGRGDPPACCRSCRRCERGVRRRCGIGACRCRAASGERCRCVGSQRPPPRLRARRATPTQPATRCVRATRSAAAAAKTTFNEEREHESNHCARRGYRRAAVCGVVDCVRGRSASYGRAVRRMAMRRPNCSARACTPSCRRRCKP